jgi:hypothetical protein
MHSNTISTGNTGRSSLRQSLLVITLYWVVLTATTIYAMSNHLDGFVCIAIFLGALLCLIEASANLIVDTYKEISRRRNIRHCMHNYQQALEVCNREGAVSHEDVE